MMIDKEVQDRLKEEAAKDFALLVSKYGAMVKARALESRIEELSRTLADLKTKIAEAEARYRNYASIKEAELAHRTELVKQKIKFKKYNSISKKNERRMSQIFSLFEAIKRSSNRE